MPRDRITVAPQVIDEAAEWFVSMREPSVSQEDCAAFAEWLRASPVHVKAYLEIAKLWGGASRISPELVVDEGADSAANVIQLKQGSYPPRSMDSHAQPARRGDQGASQGIRAKALPRRFALAASILFACLIGVGAWQQLARTRNYVTDVGEQRMITLEDGSTVRLNARSSVAVRMTSRQRHVDLLDGQAIFEVAHDSSRPFTVATSRVAIRAVGTQFDVNRRRSETVVTVIEGRVQVRPTTDSAALPGTRPTASETEAAAGSTASGSKQEQGSATILLAAGGQATVDSRGAVEYRPNANVDAATSWLKQELIFDGEPLSTVVEEFNRYSRTPIVLSDPSLADLRINAVLRATNPDALLRFVIGFEGVQVERSQEVIRIYRRP